jgi:hypothetical protein
LGVRRLCGLHRIPDQEAAGFLGGGEPKGLAQWRAYPINAVLNRRTASPSDALVFSVNNSPAEALDKLCCGVIISEMIGADELVE